MYQDIDIPSSYKENNLGKTLYNTVLRLRPFKIVEFGCLYGYSTVSMALALKELNQGKIYCYDIWEDYQYKHSTFQQTKDNIIKYGVEEYVEFIKMDYYEWLKKPEYFDLLHLDISNTGDILNQTYEALPEYSQVIFEGGSIERDQVEWMAKYKAASINSVRDIIDYKVINNNFPSISYFRKCSN